jgi:hypothetical protein
MKKLDQELQNRNAVTEIVATERARGGMAIINAILDHPQALALIQSLEPEEMHALFAEIGREDCVDLIRFATEEQFQGLGDLDNWIGKSFTPERMESLLNLSIAAGPETLDTFVDSLEDEALVLYLRKRARIVARDFDPDQDDEMSVPGIEAFHTPDTMFWIVVPAEAPYFNDLKFIIERIYDRDHLDAAALLRHAIYEDADVLEDEAARFRGERIATMGFPSVEDATALFDYMNPVQFKERMDEKLANMAPYEVEHRTLLPILLGSYKGQPEFLKKTMDGLTDDAVRRRIAEAVAYLANSIIVSRTGGDLSHAGGRTAGLRTALSILSIGLEFLSEEDVERARLVMTKVWPRTVFRAGYSLLIPLREEGRKALKYAGRAEDFYLFDPPLNEIIAGLFEEPPQYCTALENKPRPSFRDFRSVHDVARAKAALLQAIAVGLFIDTTLQLDVAKLAAGVVKARRKFVTHTTLIATALINALLGNDGDPLAPIAKQDLKVVVDLVFVAAEDGGKPTINPRLTAAIAAFVQQSDSLFAAALFDLALRKLEDLFRRYPNGIIPDAKLAAPVLLIK